MIELFVCCACGIDFKVNIFNCRNDKDFEYDFWKEIDESEKNNFIDFKEEYLCPFEKEEEEEPSTQYQNSMKDIKKIVIEVNHPKLNDKGELYVSKKIFDKITNNFETYSQKSTNKVEIIDDTTIKFKGMSYTDCPKEFVENLRSKRGN